MKARLPRPFDKPLDTGQLAKKVLGRLYIPADRAFVESLLVAGDDGLYRPRDLSPEDEARLRVLAGEIRRNSGIVSLPRIIVTVILFGGLALFYLLFRNSIVEYALESGLQAAVGARVDVHGVDINLFGPRLRWAALEVADPKRPMRNLVELGQTEVAINPGALLRGRFVADNIEIRGLGWGTERKTSGALPGAAPTAIQEGPSPISQALEGLGELFSSSFDPEALLERERSKLGSEAAFNELRLAADQARAKWEGILKEDQDRTSALVSRAEALAKRGRNARLDLARLRDLAVEAKAVGDELRGLSRDLGRRKRELTEDAAGLEAAAKALDAAIAKDRAYLQSLVDPAAPGALKLLSGLAEEALRSRLGPLYDYGRIGMDAILATKATARPSPPSARRQGRTIQFPTRGFPAFLIDRGRIDATVAGFSATGSIDALTAEHEMVGRPTSLSYRQEGGDHRVAVTALFDTRTTAETAMRLEYDVAGLAFSSTGFAAAGIHSLAANLDVTGAATMVADGLRGEASLRFSKIKLEGRPPAGPAGAVYALLRDVFTRLESFTAMARFSFTSGRLESLSVSSPDDGAVGRALGRVAAERAVEARRGVEVAFAAYAKDFRDGTGLVGTVDAFGPRIDSLNRQIESAGKNIEDSVRLPRSPF